MSKTDIVTLNIEKIERVFNQKIRRNVSVLGLDTAGKSGYAIGTTDNKKLYLSVGYIAIDIKDELKKYIEYSIWLRNLLKGKKIAVIENTFLKRYKTPRGWTVNYNAVRLLAMIGGVAIASAVVCNCEEIYLLLATQARKRLGLKGNAKKAELTYRINQLLGTSITDDNEIDAIILTFNGLIEGVDEYVKKAREEGKRKSSKSSRRVKQSRLLR